MGQAVVDEIREQFRRQWETLRELVSRVPVDQWKAGELTHLVPARLVYHILSGAEVYARTTTYEVYVESRRFGADWQGAAVAELPDQQTTLRYLREMEASVAVWLGNLGDVGLLEADPGFPWAGSRKLGRALYLLRHNQAHIGEANAELRRRGLPRGAWR